MAEKKKDEKKIKKVRAAGTSKRRGGNKPQAIINSDRYLKNKGKSNSHERLSRERFVEEKLKNKSIDKYDMANIYISYKNIFKFKK